MPVDTPIACALSQADLPQRLAEARALGADALIGVELSGAEATLSFEAERARVEAFVAGETHCCSFLEFDVVQRDGLIDLAIRTPPGGEPVLRSLVAAVVAGWEGGL